MNLEENSSYFFIRMYMWINEEWKQWREILPSISGTNWSILTPTVPAAIYKIKPTINGNSSRNPLPPKFDCFPHFITLLLFNSKSQISLYHQLPPHVLIFVNCPSPLPLKKLFPRFQPLNHKIKRIIRLLYQNVYDHGFKDVIHFLFQQLSLFLSFLWVHLPWQLSPSNK